MDVLKDITTTLCWPRQHYRTTISMISLDHLLLQLCQALFFRILCAKAVTHDLVLLALFCYFLFIFIYNIYRYIKYYFIIYLLHLLCIVYHDNDVKLLLIIDVYDICPHN